MTRRRSWPTAAVLAAFVAGCANAGEERVLAITGTGAVSGIVYFDASRNLSPDGLDTPLENVAVELRSAGGDVVESATTDAQGIFSMDAVPVGSYTVTVDLTTIGDTVEVARIDTSEIDITADAGEVVEIAVAFPQTTTENARTLAVGTSVFLEGLALSGFITFGDQTVHFRDATGALRLTRVSPILVTAGDSVRVRGKMATNSGQPVLDDVRVFFLSTVSTVVFPDTVTSADAASAVTGLKDGELVHVLGATVSSLAPSGADEDLTIDDGSGPLIVRLDGNINFDTSVITPIPGAVVNVTGVLVPTGTGSWVLKPRGNADIAVQ